jgi:hypothetical protein
VLCTALWALGKCGVVVRGIILAWQVGGVCVHGHSLVHRSSYVEIKNRRVRQLIQGYDLSGMYSR